MFVAVFLGCTDRVGLWFCGSGTPKGFTGSGSGFKASQKTGQLLKVSSEDSEKPEIEPVTPGFTRHRFIPLHHGGF